MMDFKTIANTFFFNKRDWKNVSDEDKDGLFFIFNRYMSKNFPKQAQAFNVKGTDKATAMDLWFEFMKKESRIPGWFWKGTTKRKEPPIKDYKIVQEFHDLNLNDIATLCEMFPKEVKEEIKRINLIKQEQER